MTIINARFDGKVFIPEEPVNLPKGSVLQISIPTTTSEQSTLAGLAQIAEDFPDSPDAPTDAAAQHDHYLYGTPKKT